MKHFPKVGIIGSGHLTLMAIAPAVALGIDFKSLGKSKDEPAALLSAHMVGDFNDLNTVRTFALTCDLVTFEHESIPLPIIKTLESEGIKFSPPSNLFQYSQNKALMREKLAHLPSPKWQVITESIDWHYPAIAKEINNGSEKNRVWKLNSKVELEELLKVVPKLLLEEFIEFDHEISVMVARSPHGQAATWAPTLIVKHNEVTIETVTPAPMFDDEQATRFQNLALQISEELRLIGVMAVKFFIKGEEILVSGLKLLPHDSGNWTLEGSITNQFEQHLRAILDLPLGDTSMTTKWVVVGEILQANDADSSSDMYRPYLHLLARTPGLKFHYYHHKNHQENHQGNQHKKIGHITLIGNDLENLRSEIAHALSYLSKEIDE